MEIIQNYSSLLTLPTDVLISLATDGHYPHLLIKSDNPEIISAIGHGLRNKSFKKNKELKAIGFNKDSYIPDIVEDRQIQLMFEYLVENSLWEKLKLLLKDKLKRHQQYLFKLNANLFKSITEPELIELLISNANLVCKAFTLSKERNVVLALIEYGYVEESFYELAKHDPHIKLTLAKTDSEGVFANDKSEQVRLNSLENCRDISLFKDDDSLLVLSLLIERAVEEGNAELCFFLSNKFIKGKSSSLSLAFQDMLIGLFGDKIFTSKLMFKCFGAALTRSRHRHIKQTAKSLRVASQFKQLVINH